MFGFGGRKTKLFIPFDQFHKVGGPATFMGNLHRYLDSVDFEYTDNTKNAAGIFFGIEYDIEIIKQIKDAGGFVIQRLDGVYYGKRLEQFQDVQDRTNKIYSEFADHIVFQSEYSRRQCFETFGEISEDKYSIIVNGVDRSIFPEIELSTERNNAFTFITTGNYRRIDMLEPVIKAMDEMEQAEKQFKFVVIGPIQDEFKHLLDRKYVDYKGTLGLQEVADELVRADVFVYSHLNAPCPNSVIEAISVGLPVVGFDSGSMSELLFFSKELLAKVGDNTFHSYEQFDYKLLKQKLELVITEFEEYKQRALEHYEDYDFTKTGKAYADIFRSYLSK